MKYHKIVLAGGNGYLGKVLTEYYRPLAQQIILLSRKSGAENENVRTVLWDGKTEGNWKLSIEGADMLINLCGKNVNCRYTKANREEIIKSRVVPTQLLGRVIEKMSVPPKLWINLSSATIYRHAEDRPQDEEQGEIGYGFSIDVCQKWESAFFAAKTPDTRKVTLRMGIVLGRRDSVFPRLHNLVKFGLGGRQGDGEQYVSWVHEHDAAKCTEWLLEHEELSGIVNCTAPESVKNKDLMAIIRRSYGMPFGLRSPVWLLEIGMMIIRSETELILKSRWVLPRRLLDSGYSFSFAQVEHAVKDILSIRV